MKRTIRFLLSIFISFAFCSIAFSQATLTIANVNGTAGNPVILSVQATGISDMVGFQFTIAYDNTKLTYVNCTNWGGGTNASAVQVTSLAASGKVTFVYVDEPVNIAGGKFFDINFTVNSGATGSSPVSWSDNPTQRELSNSIPVEITCNYTDGSVTISTVPQPPVATAATDITQTGFSANWNAVAGATGYRIDVSTSNTFSGFVTGYENKDVGNVLTVSVAGLNAGTTYYYRIRAYNSAGSGANSNVIQAKTVSPNHFVPKGLEIRQILPETSLKSGIWYFNWDGRNDAGQGISQGIYHLRITAGNRVNHFKIVRLE